MAACQVNPDQVRIETQSGGRIRTADYCACAFDEAMKGLSPAESQAAAFYLLTQVGVEITGTERFPDWDTGAIGAGADAVGRATQRCPRG